MNLNLADYIEKSVPRERRDEPEFYFGKTDGETSVPASARDISLKRRDGQIEHECYERGD
jgi:hypothetical protein